MKSSLIWGVKMQKRESKQKLENLCRSMGLRVGAVRTMANKAGRPSDDESLYFMLKWYKESREVARG